MVNTKSPSFVYLCRLLVILLDVLKCTPVSIPCRRLDLLLNATWYNLERFLFAKATKLRLDSRPGCPSISPLRTGETPVLLVL